MNADRVAHRLSGCIIGAFLALAATQVAAHGGHGGGGRGGGGFAGHAGPRMGYGIRGGWGGGWGRHGGYAGGWGWGWDWGPEFFDPYWYGYPWYGSAYDLDPAYATADPIVVAPSAAPPPMYWYYCPDSGAYYPYVQHCASAWRRVTPAAPSAPR